MTASTTPAQEPVVQLRTCAIDQVAMPPSTVVPPARALTPADVDAVADAFVERLSDRRTVEQITSAWSGVFDRAIGKGVRRLAYAVVLALLLFGVVKFDLLGVGAAAIKSGAVR